MVKRKQRQKIVDIKYSADRDGSNVLIIYEEE